MLRYDKRRGIWTCSDCEEEFKNKFDLLIHFTLKHAKVRKTWIRKPQTQIKRSDKIYDRKKEKRRTKKELGEK